jgi:hypothetical protein
VLDDLALDRALEGEVELLKRLAGGEPRGLDATLAAVGLAGETSVASKTSAKRS